MADFLDFKLIERHPYATGGVVVVGGVALWFFFLRGTPSSTQVAVSGSTDNPQIDLAYAQINAQLQAQGAQIAGNLAQGQLAAQTQIALQTQQLQVKSQEDDYTFQLGMQQLSSQQQIALAQLQTQLKEQADANASQVAALKISTNGMIAQSTINANLQQNLATINAQLQNNIVQAQSQNYQAQLETQEVINGQNASLAKSQSNDSMWGGIASTAIMAMAFL